MIDYILDLFSRINDFGSENAFVFTTVLILIILVVKLIMHVTRDSKVGKHCPLTDIGERIGWEIIDSKDYVKRFGSSRLMLLSGIQSYCHDGLSKEMNGKLCTLFTTIISTKSKHLTADILLDNKDKISRRRSWVLIQQPDWHFDGLIVSEYAPSLSFFMTKKRSISKKPRHGYYQIETNSDDINQNYFVSSVVPDVASTKIEKIFANLPTDLKNFELKDGHLLVRISSIIDLDQIHEGHIEALEEELAEIIRFANAIDFMSVTP